MKKIPMLFALKFDDKGRRVVDFDTFNENAIAAFCDGEAIATQKIDGTAMMLDDNGKWFSRRIVKPRKKIPNGFVEVDFDENTGKHVGWIPAEDSPFVKFWKKALDSAEEEFSPGTFELIGPKINGNRENVEKYMLVPHGKVPIDSFPSVEEIVSSENPHDLLESFFIKFRESSVEGVVWWVGGNPVVKLRVKDFFPEMDSRF